MKLFRGRPAKLEEQHFAQRWCMQINP